MQEIEQKALKVVRVLRQNGHKVFYAGGCVRDKLLGLPFKDIDIATSAQPDEIMRLLKIFAALSP